MKCARCLAILGAAVALSLTGCISPESREASRVLSDIDAGAAPSELKAATPLPLRQTVTYEIAGRAYIADLYDPLQPVGAGLVLVPGFTPDGKDDARLVNLALSLSRARFLVLVPDLRGPREMRVRLEDSRGIADAAIHLAQMPVLKGQGGVGVAAISYAAGLAVLAALESDAQPSIRFLVSIGGYYDTAALAIFVTTGKYRTSSAGPWRSGRPERAAKWFFLAGSIDLLDDAGDRAALQAIAERRLDGMDGSVSDLAIRLGPEGRSLLELIENRNPDRVQALLAKLPERIRAHLRCLSLRNYDLSSLAGRLLLVHGREDTMIPYTESEALAAAVPSSQLFLIDGFSHIDSNGVGLTGQLQLIDAMQALLKRRIKHDVR
jgi:pimeloyl-ACP methyl ester carboxylesterase